MPQDSLETARKFMSLRKFDEAIRILESRGKIYEEEFEYYLLFGIACLYAGDTGTAAVNFQKARAIKITDTDLMLGQAALFLRRGDVDRALNYYVDILENDPSNKIARSAMEFIRLRGDYNTICKWVDTGKIECFYPPVGINFYRIFSVVFPVVFCILGSVFAFNYFTSKPVISGPRADLSDLVLSVEEKYNAQEKDLSSGSFLYILSNAEITKAYEKAQNSYHSYKDNEAQIEINRILNSNASLAIKQKARLLMDYLEEPSFDKLKDYPTYQMVCVQPELYLDCWVIWSGRVSNVSETESYYRCDLLVGYESMEKVEGIVPVDFEVAPVIQNDKPVKILGRISVQNGKLCLIGRQVYQSVKD